MGYRRRLKGPRPWVSGRMKFGVQQRVTTERGRDSHSPEGNGRRRVGGDWKKLPGLVKGWRGWDLLFLLRIRDHLLQTKARWQGQSCNRRRRSRQPRRPRRQADLTREGAHLACGSKGSDRAEASDFRVEPSWVVPRQQPGVGAEAWARGFPGKWRFPLSKSMGRKWNQGVGETEVGVTEHEIANGKERVKREGCWLERKTMGEAVNKGSRWRQTGAGRGRVGAKAARRSYWPRSRVTAELHWWPYRILPPPLRNLADAIIATVVDSSWL